MRVLPPRVGARQFQKLSEITCTQLIGPRFVVEAHETQPNVHICCNRQFISATNGCLRLDEHWKQMTACVHILFRVLTIIVVYLDKK